MRLFYRTNFFKSEFFLTELNFLKGDTNIYFKQITFFEKKFCKNHTYFFLKNVIFFSLVLLHLNNHNRKSVFKVLSLSTEMQFSTDLALMNTQPQRIKVDDATRTNDSRDIS